MEGRLIFEPSSETQNNINTNSDLFLSTSPDFIKKHLHDKAIFIVEDKPVLNPIRELSLKIESNPPCSKPFENWYWKK